MPIRPPARPWSDVYEELSALRDRLRGIGDEISSLRKKIDSGDHVTDYDLHVLQEMASA